MYWGQIWCYYAKRSLLHRLQAQTLPEETPPIGRIHPYNEDNYWRKKLFKKDDIWDKYNSIGDKNGHIREKYHHIRDKKPSYRRQIKSYVGTVQINWQQIWS